MWKPELDPSKETIIMVIKTLIYGVRSSGGQTQVALNTLADFCSLELKKHHLGAAALKNETYVDDILNSEDSVQTCRVVAEEISAILNLGGMSVKDFTFSESPPTNKVSVDGESIGLDGYLWQTEVDTILL